MKGYLMKLFDAFNKEAPNMVFLSIFLGALSGISYAFLIPIVLSAIDINQDYLIEYESGVRTFLSIEVSNYKVATLFLIVCCFILITRTLSQVILTTVSINLTKNIRLDLYKRIMTAPIDVLEKLGSPKLIATITTDVGRIVFGARLIPDILVNIVTIIGLLGFLMYLNMEVFWFVMGAITFGIITFQLPILASNFYFEQSRKKVDDLQEAIRGLIYGAKELKLNDVKSRTYFRDVLLSNEIDVRKSDKIGNTIVQVASNYGDMISFFVIGIVTFIFINYESISNEELVGVVMALLYITSPIAIVLNSLPQLVLAKVSMRKVNSIFDEIQPEDICDNVVPLEAWNEISFSKVSYQYQTKNKSEAFKVGPVDFTINKSSITFIVGGNGSGKSTLSKLLTLHHAPTSGVIKFGKTIIDKSTIKSARQYISSIYSDYYLFDRLLDGNHDSKKDEIQRYLKELGLDSKVVIENGHFSTLNLSDGQKRRLALLVAFLENKELYLFDEWAADQDPMFKNFFYYTVLPQLKNAGKAVVVISHDDRYFDIADKVITMENGILLSCTSSEFKEDERKVESCIS